ncbi:MAG: GNAT family N-acetyltransferase [Colwellia sp.]|nr:GNAT family N-acetyltransferase [Colwellia sp.]NQZ80650.1 GNAT family N-acetyltransferase [Colwellia sp.]
MKISSDTAPDLYLQYISIDDANKIYVDWLNDPLINQYLETRFHIQNINSIREFISSMIANPNEHLFTIRTTCNEQHIGNIKVGGINTTHNIADVSLFIGDKDSWGKGFATKAIQLISRYALENLQLRKLCAGAYKPNIASTRAFLKAGYINDGFLANHYLLNGQPCDLVQVCLFENKHTIIPSIIIS